MDALDDSVAAGANLLEDGIRRAQPPDVLRHVLLHSARALARVGKKIEQENQQIRHLDLS